MVKLTQSFYMFMWKKDREKLVLISSGHTELVTKELYNEYLEWCKTDEGEKHLVGGEEYDENWLKKSDWKIDEKDGE